MGKLFLFTQLKIDSLSIPEHGKRAYYKDEKEAGLILDVRSSGSKSFYLYKKINGRPERILLGQYPDMKIPEARAKAAVLKGQIAKGINPQEEKRKIRQEITFGDLFNQYMERYSKLQKRSWMYDEREVNKFLSHWLKRKVSSIKKYEVQRLHEDIRRNNGLYQANRILERVRGIYNKGIEWGLECENPATGIKKFKEQARDRFIQPNELPLIFAALEQDENQTTKDYFYIALMTGARKTNILKMRWEQISWETAQWRIPDTKNGEPVIVPLIEQALQILERRKAKSKSRWVFEGDGKDGHFSCPKHSWDRIRQTATLELWRNDTELSDFVESVETRLQTQDNYGYTVLKLVKEIQKEAKAKNIELPVGMLDLRIHDIRRTMGSYQAITGASLPIIGKSLGHKSAQATSIYARLNVDPVRDAMNKATDAMFGFAKE